MAVLGGGGGVLRVAVWGEGVTSPENGRIGHWGVPRATVLGVLRAAVMGASESSGIGGSESCGIGGSTVKGISTT